jgi:hypothetical protein
MGRPAPACAGGLGGGCVVEVVAEVPSLPGEPTEARLLLVKDREGRHAWVKRGDTESPSAPH